MNKLVQIILPAYAPSQHLGQTPSPWQTKTIAKFENVLVDRSNLVLKADALGLQRHDTHGRAQVTLRIYTVVLDMTSLALAEVVASALDLFGLKNVTVVVGENAQVWTQDDVDAFDAGIHAWNLAGQE